MGVLCILGAFSLSLETTRYTVTTPKVSRPITLAVVSDLHGCLYGDGQQELLEAIESQSPDAVVYTGDIMDSRRSSEHTITLFEAIGGKYPAYYAAGNHELRPLNIGSFAVEAEHYGIKVLRGDVVTLTVGDQQIQIAGADDPQGGPEAFLSQLSQVREQLNPELYTVLLNHRPEKWEDCRRTGADLTISGHAHGGQWRIPHLLEQGLFTPHQGFFPNHTSGVFEEDGQTLIVSRGLAKENVKWIPRIFNRPELVIVTIAPQIDG